MKRLRWVLMIIGDVLVLTGCALFDFVYPFQDKVPQSGALGIGLIVSGAFWIINGCAIFDRKS